MQSVNSNLANLPDDAYSQIIPYLNQQELSLLSLTSKKVYLTIFRIASETPLIWYDKVSSPRLLTFTERTYPSSENFVQEPKDALMLSQRRMRNITFSSDPRNEQFVTILNRAFPKGENLTGREDYVTSSKENRALLANEHQRWMQEEVFAGPVGLEPGILFGNLKNLRDNVRKFYTTFPIEFLKNTTLIFSEIGGPRLIKNEDPLVLSLPEEYEQEVNKELYIPRMTQAMHDINDNINLALKFGEDSFFIHNLMISLKKLIPSVRFLQSIPSERFAEDFGLLEADTTHLKAVLTETLSHFNLMNQAQQLGTYNPETTFIEINIFDYKTQLNALLPILQKGMQAKPAILTKRDQHVRVFWRAVFLEDRETLSGIIRSHAFFYINWERALEIIFKNQKLHLFLFLISHPQVIVNLPLTFKSSNNLTRYFLPFLLGHHATSPSEWECLIKLNLANSHSPKLFGIVLNALVREGRVDSVRKFLAFPDWYRKISSRSTPNALIPFLERYPLLWDRLCLYPEEGAQLLAKTIQNSSALNLFVVLEAESVAETIQFLLTHPEIIKSFGKLKPSDAYFLPDWRNCPPSFFENLTTEDSIRAALIEPDLTTNEQLIIDTLATILFAHDRYFLQVLIKLIQKDTNPWFLFNRIIEIVKNGASLLTTLSKLPEDQSLPKPPPHKTLDLLLGVGCFDWHIIDTLPKIGWDTIFANASPPLLEVLASCTGVALEVPQELRKKYLSPHLKLKEASFQAFLNPQQGSTTTVAQDIGALLQSDASLDQRVWKAIATKCSFFRRVAVAFKLPQFLSPGRYSAFYQELPLFYRLLGKFSYFFFNIFS